MAHEPGSADAEPPPAGVTMTPTPESEPTGAARRGGRWRRAVVPLIVAVVALAVVAIVAVSYFQHVEKHRDETWAALNEIARLKAGEVALWVREREADAGILLDDPGLARNCRFWFLDGQSMEFRRDSVPLLESIARRYGYYVVAVVDASGAVRYSVSGRSVDDLAVVEALLVKGAASHKVAGSDLYLGQDGTPYVDWLVPLFAETGPKRGSLAGGVLLRADPARYLFPLLSSWPGREPTAETLLVRRDGQHVVFLNPLRFRRDAALRFRLPVDTDDLPAARVVSGETGVVEGVDYRGAEVLAAYRPVPGTGWGVVAKVDTEDVYAPITREAWLVVLLTAALLGAGGLTVGLVWRRHELRAARLEARVAGERAALTEHYALLTRHASDAMLLHDHDWRIVECNDRATEVYGYAREELLTLTVTDLLAPGAAATGLRERERLDEGGSVIYQTRHRRRDGSEIDVEISARVVEADGQRFTQEMVRDVSDRVAAERALAERERTLSTLLGNLPGMAYRCRNVPGWTMEFVSGGCRDLTGYEADEIIDDRLVAFEDLIHPDDRRRVRTEVARALVSDGRFTVMYRISRRDGEERWLWDRGRPVGGTGSAAAVHEGFMTDITDRVAAERGLAESEQRFRSLFERLEQGVFYADAEGRIVAANPAAERILGIERDDLVGRALSDPRWRVVRLDGTLVPSSDYPSVVALAGGHPVTGMLFGILREHDGETRWVIVDSVPEFAAAGAGVPTGVFCALADVTERVIAENGLRELSEDLERRVEERTAELRAAMRELEAFSYSVSHDLRAPLRAIDGFSLALVEDHGEKLPPEGREYLRRVRTASQRMGDLIDDMLSLSRVTRAEMTLRRVDLSALAEEVVGELRSLSGEDNVTYSVAPGATAVVDPHLVRVLLTNLMDNARKFSLPVEHPIVEFGHAGGGEARTTFFVRDNGVGFDLSFAERLFDPFQRFHAPGEFEGTGVGLATACRVVRRHGGWIWAESAPGEGATFYFTFGDGSDSVAGSEGGPTDAVSAGEDAEEDAGE